MPLTFSAKQSKNVDICLLVAEVKGSTIIRNFGGTCRSRWCNIPEDLNLQEVSLQQAEYCKFQWSQLFWAEDIYQRVIRVFRN
jgi:hypothetical protein